MTFWLLKIEKIENDKWITIEIERDRRITTR